MKPKSNPPQPEKSDVTIFGIYLLHGNLKPLRFRRSAGVSCFDISDWKRCRMKHNESPTLFVRGHYRFCFCVVLVFQFYVTRSEMNLVLLFVSYSLLPCSFLFVLTNTQSQISLISCDYYIQKEWVLNIYLFDIRGLPQPMR